MAIITRRYVARDGTPTTYLRAETVNASGRKISKAVETIGEGERWIAERKAEVRAGIEAKTSGRIKLSTVAERWLATVKARDGDTITVRQHEAALRHYILPQLGHLAIAAVSEADTDEFFRWLARPLDQKEISRDEQGRATGRKGGALSVVTQRRIRVTLKAVLIHARKSNQIRTVPLGERQVVKPAETAPANFDRDEDALDCPSLDEATAIVRQARREPAFTRAAVLLSYLAGLRGQEILALKWGGVDLAAGTVAIVEAVDATGRFKTTKTKAGRRTIAVDDEVTAALAELKKERDEAFTGEGDLVLCNGEGKVYGHANLLRRVFWPVQVRAGVSRHATNERGEPVFVTERPRGGKATRVPKLVGRYGIHAGRHSFASTMIVKHMPYTELSAYLGHRNVTTTLRIYSHAIASMVERGQTVKAALATVYGKGPGDKIATKADVIPIRRSKALKKNAK